MDKFNELINGLVAEKSLSFELLDQLKRVKDESDLLQKALKENEEVFKKKDEEILALRSEKREVTEKNSSLTTELDAYKAREEKIKDFEHQKALLDLRMDVKEIVGMVFKNTTIRESINKSVGHVVPNGTSYPSYSNTQDTENKETKSE